MSVHFGGPYTRTAWILQAQWIGPWASLVESLWAFVMGWLFVICFIEILFIFFFLKDGLEY